jgi:hypothetical protein
MRVFFAKRTQLPAENPPGALNCFVLVKKEYKKPVMPLRGVRAQRAMGMEDES